MLADWRGVQLNTSPQPKEGSTYINTSSARLPFTVEGVIQSDNPKRIETVTVEVEISFVKNEEVRRVHVQIISTTLSHNALFLQKSYSKRQTISLVGSEMYFKCQFMLHVPQVCFWGIGKRLTSSALFQMANLKMGISFTDSEVKRTWLDESTIQFALHPRE
jgi:hypothetical protein